MISSAQNTQVKNIIKLNQKAKVRREQGLFIAEGRKMFLEAPDDWIEKIYVAESMLEDEEVMNQLVPGRELWLGGIKFEHELGLLGHSDADVLIHAICDALLGAANMRDIGYHFPDTAGEFKNIDSKILLAKTVDLIATKGYKVGNIDATVCAERPKLKARIPEMQEVLAHLMKIELDDVSIKATTTEKLGFTGREEGISAYATVLIEG